MTPRDALAELIAAVEHDIATKGEAPTVRLRRALDAGREALSAGAGICPADPDNDPVAAFYRFLGGADGR